MHALSRSGRVFAGAAVAVLGLSVGAAAATTSKPDTTRFRMFPQTSFVNCMKPSPDAPTPASRWRSTVTIRTTPRPSS